MEVFSHDFSDNSWNVLKSYKGVMKGRLILTIDPNDDLSINTALQLCCDVVPTFLS